MHRGQQRTDALLRRSFALMPPASPGGWMVWVRCPTRLDAPRATRRPQGSAIVSKLSPLVTTLSGRNKKGQTTGAFSRTPRCHARATAANRPLCGHRA